MILDKALLGALAIMTAIAVGLGVWALFERAGRLECKVELVAAVDQVKVLADSLERQSEAIDKLGRATAGVVDRTGRILGQLELAAAGDRKTISSLRSQLETKTPLAADGTLKGCADYLKEWRAEP
jgi:hypothetical protein